MAESRRYAVGVQLDIEQILLEAQHRWLRPAEICEILRNYKKFSIATEPGNKPPSGSLFLFDRKVLRYFRKDGHNWRKKKDGKTVKEAHERLKAGSIDVLHCYYAHGEENGKFQRRSYWLLEEEHSHIVFVHYREVKGSRTNFNPIREAEEAIPNIHENSANLSNSEVDSSASSKFHPYNYYVASQVTDASLNSAQASECDAESAYDNQSSSGFHSLLELQPSVMERMGDRLLVPYPTPLPEDDYQGKFSAITKVDFASLPEVGKENHNNGGLMYEPEKLLQFSPWENMLENITAENYFGNLQSSLLPSQRGIKSMTPGQGNETPVQVSRDDLGIKQEFGNHAKGQELWQTSAGDSSYIPKCSADLKLHQDSLYCPPGRFHEDHSVDLLNPLDPGSVDSAEKSMHAIQNNLQGKLINAESGSVVESDSNSSPCAEGKFDSSGLKQPFLDGILREGLKKLDSFDQWMSKELGDVNEPPMQPSSGAYWETIGSEDAVPDSSISPEVHLDSYVLGPSLSQDQLFSIIDFSPNWAYAGLEIKVLVMGRFLKNKEDVENCKWACMFGELEVQAEVIADGVLLCHTPPHRAERVPFYVTCSNRLACSEVREFEYRVSEVQDVDVVDINSGSSNEAILHIRFRKLLFLVSASPENSVSSGVDDDFSLRCKISLLMEDDNQWDNMLKTTWEDQFSPEKVQERLLQKRLKEKLHAWLLRKVAEGGKGPSVLDEGGQGVLHFAAALGYDWAIKPIVAAGVNINFRDTNGWTALHWAASSGRERTVGFLISLGAAPGALTDPTPKYPSGSTPADLASRNEHKGIAGYLAESALSRHLSSLQLKDIKESDDENSILKAVQMVSERTATPISDGDLAGLSLKDSLAAVRNATQAAARIHQVFRVQSFQKKQLKEYSSGEFGMSDERALSLIAVKSNKTGQYDEPAHAAAIRIQNKFRGWKGRREFLTIRQRIVKIQAHVRGHQVRKNYKKITWSVGILEKVILRWRRKGSGLRGFRSEAVTEGRIMQDSSSKDDDYDFLKEGRKQTEARLQKALDRVKSMVQYPEARDQYRRLLNVVSEIQETKAVSDGALDSSNEPFDFDEDLMNLEALLDDDMLMLDEYGISTSYNFPL